MIWDAQGTHTREDKVRKLKNSYGTETLVIAKRFTHVLQPIDVCFNAPFKQRMRVQWNQWYKDGPKLFTKAGNRKPPSYQKIVDMVSESIRGFPPSQIKKSFRCCGIAANGKILASLIPLLSSRFSHPASYSDDILALILQSHLLNSTTFVAHLRILCVFRRGSPSC